MDQITSLFTPGTPLYYAICGVLSLLVLVGIAMMSKVKTASMGNAISALAIALGIIITLLQSQVLSLPWLIGGLLIGGVVGTILFMRVQMIQMPQMVALLNGVGGGASALVGALALFQLGMTSIYFTLTTAFLAVIIGMLTLVGSLVAAGKLHRLLPQKSVVWVSHNLVTLLTLLVSIAFMLVGILNYGTPNALLYTMIGTMIFASLFGLYFSIRVGGADMPITISLLNSLSGVAGAIAGMAIGDIFLVSVGGIVGASGLLLTQIMCRAMNRSLVNILFPHSKSIPNPVSPIKSSPASTPTPTPKTETTPIDLASDMLRNAHEVIIVPGYGMALAQAQMQVKQLADKLTRQGANVRYAIHPVAGRMPGHMNVLLAEANVDYDVLYEMEAINDQFAQCDAVIVIGANDVLNPAARNAEGTPIYGMPVLNVDQAPQVIICNYDLKPGYAGVDNPLYSREEGVALCLGDAKATLEALLTRLEKKDSHSAQSNHISPSQATSAELSPAQEAAHMLCNAHEVIIVPGYGMALAQAQMQVKQLADKLTRQGANVRYAIHPVAGRMPGHMNVLLAEANVDYDVLYEMEAINDQFAQCDAVVVIGANDVLNPAARNAEGTPIYGMPVLNVDQAPQVIICNYDLKPGYAGVDNPLYSREEGVALCLGDAKASLTEIMDQLDQHPSSEDSHPTANTPHPLQEAGSVLRNAHEVIIVPGYGMALAQAQMQVKQLADKLTRQGANVRYAIHPVAGRMPGHMNVLLAEANVDYDVLYEMEAINDQFAQCDAVIVIGANDVLNPAARNAEGTPIYGMPVLNVDQAPQIIICNYDLKPGYAGVDNPLYSREEGVTLLIGDAKETLERLLEIF